jgi:hypothetical protein
MTCNTLGSLSGCLGQIKKKKKISFVGAWWDSMSALQISES